MSSLRTYSPTSAWWNTTIAMGSTFRQSCVDLAATPNPWGSKKEREQGGSCSPAPVPGSRRRGAHQRDVGHGVHHHALVLRRVLRDAAQARLQHVVAVEEGLLGAGLHPHLVLRERHRGERLGGAEGPSGPGERAPTLA